MLATKKSKRAEREKKRKEDENGKQRLNVEELRESTKAGVAYIPRRLPLRRW